MDIVWLARAQRELIHIHDCVAADNPQAAVQVVHRIHGAVVRLADTPAIGRPGRLPGTRELVVTGTPFIVPYRVREDVIEILSVIHGARKWPENL
ncbi:MAG: type II toxin-antitoxin system RelE/ParE family toxin [Rhodospirillales bacterium]|nr:type II toxin-antitoxin system RelE/ParE family toxin [Rhodospirillales bacterium]